MTKKQAEEAGTENRLDDLSRDIAKRTFQRLIRNLEEDVSDLKAFFASGGEELLQPGGNRISNDVPVTKTGHVDKRTKEGRRLAALQETGG